MSSLCSSFWRCCYISSFLRCLVSSSTLQILLNISLSPFFVRSSYVLFSIFFFNFILFFCIIVSVLLRDHSVFRSCMDSAIVRQIRLSFFCPRVMIYSHIYSSFFGSFLPNGIAAFTLKRQLKYRCFYKNLNLYLYEKYHFLFYFLNENWYASSNLAIWIYLYKLYM